jgi:hypothetical protein
MGPAEAVDVAANRTEPENAEIILIVIPFLLHIPPTPLYLLVPIRCNILINGANAAFQLEET